jgi:hypothetical protein
VKYNANTSTVYLTVDGASNAGIIRETKYVFPYQPGKSLLIMNTFVMPPVDPHVTQRVGYYGQNNGIYFESSDQYYLVKRNNGVETRVPQTQWNGTTLINILDATKAQIFWMDIEWLGVGSVRTGFVLDSQYFTCHTFKHANYATGTYMGTACLPCRYEIFNTGTPTISGNLQQICTTVISEGGYTPGSTSAFNIQANTITTNSTVLVPIMSIQLNPATLDSIVRISKVEILSASKNNLRWALVLNPTLTGASFIQHPTSGAVYYDSNATAMTGGTVLNSGLTVSGSVDQYDITTAVYQIGRSQATQTSDTITLGVLTDGNNSVVQAILAWVQI